MKQLLFTLITLVILHFSAHAQNYSLDFGRISQAEADLLKYEPDTTAEAVVFFDLGKSHFECSSLGFNLIYERTTRIKILSEAGLKWGNVKIHLYRDGDIYEKILSLEGTTYNVEDGKLKKSVLIKNDKHEEIINKYWEADVFAMPDIKVGSIIEYKYQVQSERIFNLRDWEFQRSIPTIYSRYEARMIPFYTYTFLLQGATKFDEMDKKENHGHKRYFAGLEYNDLIYTFGMKNLPAFKDEEFIACEDDYITKIDFQLARVIRPDGVKKDILTTWPKMIEDLVKHESFGKYLKKSKRIASKLINVDSLLTLSEMKRFDYVVSYMKKNYSWDEFSGEYAYKSAKEFNAEKTGNAGAVNLFLCGMLQAVGLQAQPVILSTRSHGKIKYDYPFSHFFNYTICIVNVNGKHLLADATEPMTSNKRIPEHCLNDRGLLIGEGKTKWISLDCHFPSSKQTNITMDFINDSVNASVMVSSTEYDALHLRHRFGNNPEKLTKNLEDRNYNLEDSSVGIRYAEKYSMPYSYGFKSKKAADIIKDKIYISPFLNESVKDNPLKQKTRNYPMDMTYPKERILNTTIMIPEGYTIDYVPYNRSINNDLFEMEYKIGKSTDRVVVKCRYYFKKTVYHPENYNEIKKYFTEIVRKTNEKIVLVETKVENNLVVVD